MRFHAIYQKTILAKNIPGNVFYSPGVGGNKWHMVLSKAASQGHILLHTTTHTDARPTTIIQSVSIYAFNKMTNWLHHKWALHFLRPKKKAIRKTFEHWISWLVVLRDGGTSTSFVVSVPHHHWNVMVSLYITLWQIITWKFEMAFLPSAKTS